MPTLPPLGTVLEAERHGLQYVLTAYEGDRQRVVLHEQYTPRTYREGGGSACSDFLQRGILVAHRPVTILHLDPPLRQEDLRLAHG